MIRIYSYIEEDDLKDDEPCYIIFDTDENKRCTTCKTYEQAKSIIKDWESIGYKTN